MAQKANPLALRYQQSIKISTHHLQVYNKKYLPYVINEQEKTNTFLSLFFKHLGLKVHSFNLIKDQRGNVFYSIKYANMKELKNKKRHKGGLNFLRIEDSLSAGLEMLGSKKPISVLLYEVTTEIDEKTNLLHMFKNFKFFTSLEIVKIIRVVKHSKGVSFFLATLFCEKLEKLRSKTDKKLQSRLFIFVEKLLYFLYCTPNSSIKGIRVQIKGRINGTARSKKTIICFGTLALQQIDRRVEFFYKQALTIFGCFGIKIWISYP